ncbi:hypothetical protein RQP53_10530 [Paucibacter sp. APW11]|uniref:Uncharacterized protein n=1 Tax=Roseateles aquae TaxID=3077235 RepID=A0ABU3PAU0_9BURK|nr:hypothetical protein [Paucibacter sp. APW11]MDT8999702.1 hypothetical protein [Paucibacter sp. APW11]
MKKKPTAKPAVTVDAASKTQLLPASLAFLKRYSFESLLSIGLIALVSPGMDRAKEAVLGQNEGPAFYIDKVACPPVAAASGVANSASLGGDCSLLNIRIPGGLHEKTLSRIEIIPYAADPEIRFSEPIEATIDKEVLRTYGYASISMKAKVGQGKVLIATALGHFSDETELGVTLDGVSRQARKLAIADGRVLFITQYWRQILLIAIAGLFTVRYRQLVLERLGK